MNNSSQVSLRFIALLLLATGSTQAPAAAIIIPTGGLLEVSPPAGDPVLVDAEYEFTHAARTVLRDNGDLGTTAAVVTAYAPGNIHISAAAYDVPRAQGNLSGVAAGTIGFDLTESSRVNFNFARVAYDAWNAFADASLVIRDAQGSIVLGCTAGSPNVGNTFGGCAQGQLPSPTPGQALLPTDSFIQMLAGHYDISFVTSARSYLGSPQHSEFKFTLTVVPLPAALPLLFSGLGLLSLWRRRSTTSSLPATA